MNNNKLAKAKDAIRKFYDDHYIEITNGLMIGIPLAFGVTVVALERHWYHKNITTVAGCDILNDADVFGVEKDDVTFTYAKKTVGETIESIKENGFAISEQGLELMKTIIDNPVIVD